MLTTCYYLYVSKENSGLTELSSFNPPQDFEQIGKRHTKRKTQIYKENVRTWRWMILRRGRHKNV